MLKLIILLIISIVFYNTAQAQVYQLPNSGFEIWDGNSPDDEPSHWSGFPSAQCNLYVGCGAATITRHAKSQDIRPGSSGNYSLRLFATKTSILGNEIIANGAITTGQIRIGSTTPSSSQNYNITRRSIAKHNQTFHAKPDSISFWAKFICPSTTQNAKMIATIHGNYDYREPEASDPNSLNYIVGKAEKLFKRGNQNWNKYTVPFNYDFPANEPHYILITFTTNEIPGAGSEFDNLYIDDIEMIYNPLAADIKVNGVSIDNFNPHLTEYNIFLPCGHPADVSAIAQSPNAHVSVSQINQNSSVAVVTISAGDTSIQYHVNFIFREVLEVSAEICQGEPFNKYGFDLPQQMTPGTFFHQIVTYSSILCDSIINLNLTVHPVWQPDTINAMICEGSYYDFNGRILTDEGIYDTIIPSIHGCDSIVVLNLEVGDFYRTEIIASICEGEVYDLHGFYRSEPGTDTLIYQAENLCDSLVILYLSVYPHYEYFIVDTITEGEAYYFHGFDIPEIALPGQYYYENELFSIFGCDSTIFLDLTVLPNPEDPHDPSDPDEYDETEEGDEFNVSIYPNPALEMINIEITDTPFSEFEIRISEVTGKVLLTKNINKRHKELSLHELRAGVYIIEISTPDLKKRTIKFSKN